MATYFFFIFIMFLFFNFEQSGTLVMWPSRDQVMWLSRVAYPGRAFLIVVFLSTRDAWAIIYTIVVDVLYLFAVRSSATMVLIMRIPSYYLCVLRNDPKLKVGPVVVLINSLWPSDAIWPHRSGPGNGLLPDGTKPMLTKDYWHPSLCNFTENPQVLLA